MVQMLPGRFVPNSGTLHRYPATEQCNLDDTDQEVRVETLAGLSVLPHDTKLCEFCFTPAERAEAAGAFVDVPATDPVEPGVPTDG